MPVEQLVVVVHRLGHERVHVRPRCAVAEQDVAVAVGLGQLGEPCDDRRPSASTTLASAVCRSSPGGMSSRSPRCQRSQLPRIQTASASSSMRAITSDGQPPKLAVVAAEHPARDLRVARIGQDRLERRQVAVHVVEQSRRHERGSCLTVQLIGQTLTLRYAEPGDAAALFLLASDPEVTRWFSWGPYASADEPRAYIDRLAGERERGERLDLLIDHARPRRRRRDGPQRAVAPRPPRDGRHLARARPLGHRRQRRVQGADPPPRVRGLRARARRRVLQRRQRALDARAGEAGLPP